MELRRPLVMGVLILTLVCALLVLLPNVAQGKEWVVDSRGYGDFTRIQDAVDAAGQGDIIRVNNGTHHANITIDKPLTLVGEDPETTFIIAFGEFLEAVTVTSDHVNISGFYIERGEYRLNCVGIMVMADNCQISDNHFLRNTCDIRLTGCNNTIITNNTFSELELQGSHNVTIHNNTISSGITLKGSGDNTITNNDHDTGIYGFSLYLEGSAGNLIANNTLWKEALYSAMFGDISGTVTLEDSHGNVILNNSFVGGYYGRYSHGVYLNDSNRNLIAGNNFSARFSRPNIYLASSMNNILAGNNMSTGVLVSGDSREHWTTQEVDTQNLVGGRQLVYLADQDGGTVSGDPGQIILAGCTGMTLEDLNMTGNSAGILLGFSSQCLIRNISLEHTSEGLRLYASHDNRVTDGTFNAGYDGITLESSCRNIFTGNNVTGRYGATAIRLDEGSNSNSFLNNGVSSYSSVSTIDIWHSRDNVLRNNSFHGYGGYGVSLNSCVNTTLENNMLGRKELHISGDSPGFWNTHTIPATNTMDEGPVRYYRDRNGGTVSGAAGQIILAGSTNMVIQGLNGSQLAGSVLLGFSHDNRIANCLFPDSTQSDLEYGIVLYASSYNTLVNITFLEIDSQGIKLEGSHFNILKDTNYANGGYSLRLEDSHDNIIENASSRGNYRSGIHLANSHNNTIRDTRCWANHESGLLLESSNGNRLLDITARDNGNAGIELEDSHNNLIAGGNCGVLGPGDGAERENDDGISLYMSDNNTLMNNSCAANWNHGILLSYSSGNLITGNTCTDNENGIYLKGSDHTNTIEQNNCTRNGKGIVLGSLFEGVCSGNRLVNNSCVNNTWSGIQVDNAQDSTLAGNDCSRCQEGVFLWGSDGNALWNNTSANNTHCGVIVLDSDNNTVQGNVLATNARDGLFISDSSNITITGNTITGNAIGINIGLSIFDQCRDIVVHSNDIFRNENGLNATMANGSVVNASGNWWGDGSGPYHQEENPLGLGDGVTGPVEFAPWSGTWHLDRNNGSYSWTDEDTDATDAVDDYYSPGFYILLALIIFLLLTLLAVVRSPDKDHKKQHPSVLATEEMEKSGTPPGPLQETVSCPHCGGTFVLGTRKRPFRFNCHFCGKDLEFH